MLNKMMESTIIQLQQVQFSWAKHEPPTLQIEHMAIQQGQHTFLFGASGSGKTTLLNLLSGVMTPQSGQVNVLGQELSKLSAMKRDCFRAQHIGVIFQQFNLLPYLSVQDNVRLATSLAKKALDQSQLETLLDQLRLPKQVLHRKAGELSVGQQQRVAVVRALINKPSLIIADEPTSALDSDTRDAFLEVLLDMTNEQQSTVRLQLVSLY